MSDWVTLQHTPSNAQALQIKLQTFIGRNHIMQSLGNIAQVYETEAGVQYTRATLQPNEARYLPACSTFVIQTDTPLTVMTTEETESGDFNHTSTVNALRICDAGYKAVRIHNASTGVAKVFLAVALA